MLYTIILQLKRRERSMKLVKYFSISLLIVSIVLGLGCNAVRKAHNLLVMYE